MTVAAPVHDPGDPVFQADPEAAYARLRAEAPVQHVPARGFWVVSTYELVKRVLRDPATFVNAVGAGRRSEPPPEVAEEVAALRAQGLPYVSALGLSDGERHARYRALVGRAFTPRALRWMEPVVDDCARTLVAALPRGEVVDVVASLARSLPVIAISRVLGLPDDWQDDVARWSAAATASLGTAPASAQAWIDVERDMLDYQRRLRAELARRREHPADDLLSVLVRPDPEHGALDDVDLVWLVRELLVAGNETTTKLVTDLVRRLSDRPQEWQRLRDDPGRAALVVEEGLRLASPVQGLFRRAVRSVELGGVALPEGAVLFVAYASANRDEEVFADPDALVPERPHVRAHLALGHGVHTCLGGSLARLEAVAAVRELAAGVERLEVVDPSGVTWAPGYVLRGVPELRVRVQPLGG